jgi:hypothetical protein
MVGSTLGVHIFGLISARTNKRHHHLLVCVFITITVVPIIKMFEWGEGDSGGHVLREMTTRGLCGLVGPSRGGEVNAGEVEMATLGS